MNNVETAFLALTRTALRAEPPADPGLSSGDWDALFALAERHKLLPLILDAAWQCPSLHAERPAAPREHPPVAAHSVRHVDTPATAQTDALRQIHDQVFQEIDFLNTVLALQAGGLDPIILKGPACRALYPKPLLRPSVDDDLLIPAEAAPAFHEALLAQGLTPDDPSADPAEAWELSYHKPGSLLYLELHKQLFDPAHPAFRAFNGAFAGAMERTVPLRVQDVTLRTLAPTDHLLFLLLHAFKHFLYSGFGLRIVTDVCLYAQRWAEEIDFARVRAVCAANRCDRFAAAIFRIGERRLGIPAAAALQPAGANFPDGPRPQPVESAGVGVPDGPPSFPEVDEEPLLADILAAGLHGAEPDRLHSANITTAAVADRNLGRAPRGGLRQSVFLPASKLAGRYPFLEKHPWLLPVAWTRRVFAYAGEMHRGSSPAASLRLGRERLELLKTYDVIDR